MDHGLCPFCCGESLSIFCKRGDIGLRCRTCRSVFRYIRADEFGRLHDEAFQDANFLDAAAVTRGPEPAGRVVVVGRVTTRSRSRLRPPPGSCSRGRVCGGSGRAQPGKSEAHTRHVGIGPLYPDVVSIPQDASFDAVVALGRAANVKVRLRLVSQLPASLQGSRLD